MNENKTPAESQEKKTAEGETRQTGKRTKKQYPLLPYLIGLFVMVVVLVVLSYLMQLRNRQELKVPASASCTVTATETVSQL